jgi:hypothetical protein
MQSILKTKLDNGDYSVTSTSATNKRAFGDSTMANENSIAPSTKRTGDDK